MVFTPNFPFITTRQIGDLQSFVETVNPDTVETSGITEVLNETGRLLVTGLGIPGGVTNWIERLPTPRVTFAKICCTSLIANANFLSPSQVEKALYALTAIELLGK